MSEVTKKAKRRAKFAEKKKNENKRLLNVSKKSVLKTNVKKCKTAIQTDSPDAQSIFRETSKALDKAAARNVIHKNTAARKKSRLAKALNAKSAAAADTEASK